MPNLPWPGVFPAVTTQLSHDQALDLDGTPRHCEALIASGVSGLIVAGSLGEHQTLDAAEKRSPVAEVVRAAAGRVRDIIRHRIARRPSLQAR